MELIESLGAVRLSSFILTVVDDAVPNSALSVDELGSRIVALAGRLACATCRWLQMLADFDARDGCARLGLASTAQWLAHACGLAHRTAVEHVRVARALAAHPRLAAEMAAGRLSYSHVRAISRIAGPDEHLLVDDLVNTAGHGTVRQLESVVRGLRTVGDAADRPGDLREEYVSHGWTAESQWRLTARLDPERGAVVDSALAAVAQAEGLSAADALVRLADIGLVALVDGGDQPRALRGDERAAVIVHIDGTRVPAEPTTEPDPAETAPRSRERSRPYARVAGGPGPLDEVVEWLLCSGRIRTVVREGTGERFERAGTRPVPSGGQRPSVPRAAAARRRLQPSRLRVAARAGGAPRAALDPWRTD